MAKGAIRVDWYPGEAMDGMKFLTVMEELAYRRIIDLLYLNGGELPDDDEIMGEQTRMFTEWPKIKASLIAKKKVNLSRGKIRNDRCTEILQHIESKIEKAIRAGKASGRVRRQVLTPDEQTFNPSDENVSTPNEPSQVVIESGSHISSEEDDMFSGDIFAHTAPIAAPAVKRSRVLSVRPPLDGFDEFWSYYPKKATKDKSRESYAKAIKAVPHEIIMAGLKQHLRLWALRDQGVKYFIPETPNATTWLNQRRFNDDMTTEIENAENANHNGNNRADPALARRNDRNAAMLNGFAKAVNRS